MEIPKTTFQNKLRNQIWLYTVIIVVILLIMFFVSLMIYNYSLNTNQAAAVNGYLTELFTSTHEEYKKYLISISHNENYQNYILNHISESLIFHSFYTLNSNKKIKSNLVLTDYNGNILLQTFNIGRDNVYFKSFTNIMRDRILNSKDPDNIEDGLYSFIETPSEYVIAGPIIKEDTVIGFAFVYLKGDDWNYELSSKEFNGVITDKFDNVIATSSKMIINNMNKFKPITDNDRVQILNSYYIIKHNELKPYNINIYSLVEASMNIRQYLLGAVIILILGISMLILSDIFSKKIAENNSKSIAKLINEIYMIKDGNLNHRINVDTGDEIGIIGENINKLVERIKVLNQRNMELINTKRISEIKQLEAQFNPHFLYNTLETIRYSIFFDTKTASDLISLLTQVLRYSINRGPDEVKFSENLEYTKLFLKIYKYRFDKNFDFFLDIADECNDVFVPKLLLQPIIENSIKYGYKERAKLNIKIYSRVEGDFLVIAVEDDGPGIGEEELKEINDLLIRGTNTTNHLGLFNTARRLILQFGEDSIIHLDSKINQGTKVTIKIKIDKTIGQCYREGDAIV